MGTARAKRLVERTPQAGGYEGKQRRDQHQVDEVLDAGAGAAARVAAGIGMDLLGHMLLERQRGDFGGTDVGEAQQVRPLHYFGLERRWIAETHVDRDVFERTSVNFCGDVIT